LTGSAYDVLHYESRGCASDHNFVENRVPIALVWEIYGDNTGLGNFLAKKNALRFFKRSTFLRNKFNRMN